MLIDRQKIYFMPYERIVTKSDCPNNEHYIQLSTKDLSGEPLYTNTGISDLLRKEEHLESHKRHRHFKERNLMHLYLISLLFEKKHRELVMRLMPEYSYGKICLPKQDTFAYPYNPDEFQVPDGYSILTIKKDQDWFREQKKLAILTNDVPVIHPFFEDFGFPIEQKDLDQFPILLKERK